MVIALAYIAQEVRAYEATTINGPEVTIATLDRPLINVHTVDLFEVPDWHEAGRERSHDDFVGACEQRRRHGEAECAGGLGVDDRFELSRLLNGEIRGLRAFFPKCTAMSGTIEYDRASESRACRQ